MALVCCRVFDICENFKCPEIAVFTGFTAIINVAIAGLAVAAAVSDDMTSCTVDKKKIWLWVAFVVALCNIAFGFYFYFRISQKLGEGKRMFTATWSILMHDCGVFLYLLVGIFMIVWASIGSQWLGEDPVFSLPQAGTAAQPDKEAAILKACDNIGDRMRILCTLFLVYMIVGGILICFAVALTCCRGGEPPQTVVHHQQHPQHQHQQPQPQGPRKWWQLRRSDAPPQQTGPPPQPMHAPPQQYQQQPQQYQQPPPQQYSPQSGAPPQQHQAPPPLNPYPAQPQYQQQQQQQQPQYQQPQHQQQPPPQQQYQQQPQHGQPPPQQQQPSQSMGEKVGNKIGAGIGRVFGGGGQK